MHQESPHAQEREAQWVQQDEEELQILRECREQLEEERASAVRSIYRASSHPTVG